MGPFARYVLTKLLTSFTANELAQFTDGHNDPSDDVTDGDPQVDRLAVRFTRDAPGLEQDIDQFGLTFARVGPQSSLAVGEQLTPDDRSNIQTHVHTFWDAIKPYAPDNVKLHEFRWSRYPIDAPLVGAVASDTEIVPADNSAGQQSTSLPPQNASTITFRTPLRKHWGRIYLPTITTQALTDDGFLKSNLVDLWAEAALDMATSIATGTGAHLVVWSRTRKAVFTPTAMESDNVTDIVRRRRYRKATYKKIRDAVA